MSAKETPRTKQTTEHKVMCDLTRDIHQSLTAQHPPTPMTSPTCVLNENQSTDDVVAGALQRYLLP